MSTPIFIHDHPHALDHDQDYVHEQDFTKT